uniref:Methyltransf_25 domain-containing protein n=1 Tax=Angiostrongylus cantonensis TaxID=6313 RepID=A0A158P7Y8_ANGCA
MNAKNPQIAAEPNAFLLVIIFSDAPELDAEALEGDISYSEKEFMSLLVSTYGYNRLLRRVLRAAMKEHLLMTYAYLKFPQKLMRSALDTSKWKIDFDIAPYGTSRTMASEIFASGSVSRTNTSNTHVLVVGLGGGFVSGHLHQNFPQMRITAVEISPATVNMAKKWFSLETDDRYQVVVDDGVQYLRRSVEQGQQFDAIILDACYMQLEADIICPDEAFHSEETIKNMATLLGQRGESTEKFVDDRPQADWVIAADIVEVILVELE